jgi:hypothetical protein
MFLFDVGESCHSSASRGVVRRVNLLCVSAQRRCEAGAEAVDRVAAVSMDVLLDPAAAADRALAGFGRPRKVSAE